MKSAVAGSGPLDESASAWLFDSFPEDLGADPGSGELSFEVSARSNLEPVMVAVAVMALHDLAVDLFNVSFPRLQAGGVEVIVVEVNFV